MTFLENQRVEFSLSVPFERFAELKQIIQERKRWKWLNDRWSFVEIFRIIYSFNQGL
jgi:hypothetical protein